MHRWCEDKETYETYFFPTLTSGLSECIKKQSTSASMLGQFLQPPRGLPGHESLVESASDFACQSVRGGAKQNIIDLIMF